MKDKKATKDCSTCKSSTCSAAKRRPGESDEEFKARQKLASRLCGIRHRLVVLSGKGGVGKSTVAVNLAVALSMKNLDVGLLDIDIHGPSIPTLLGLEDQPIYGDKGELLPVKYNGLKVISPGFLLHSQDDAIIWRGPMKTGVIKQFISEVAWGELDYLVVDSPPGTGDEPLSVCQVLERVDGAIIVTTPQRVAAVDVRKCITFCRKVGVPVIGVIENMSGFVCPRCGEVTHIFRSGGGREISENVGVPFLGAIPIDPAIAEKCDSGQPFVKYYPDSPASRVIMEIVEQIEKKFNQKSDEATTAVG